MHFSLRSPVFMVLLICGASSSIYMSLFANWPIYEDLQFALWFTRLKTGEYSWLNALAAYNGNHRVGGQIITGVGLFYLTGVTFWPILLLSYVLLAITALLLLRHLDGNVSRAGVVAGSFSVPLLLFHPNQTSHLTWPYELGWFVVTFILVLNTVAIEFWKRPWPVVFIGTAFASMCAAHGMILWLVAAFQCVLLYRLSHRFLWAAVLLLLFAVFVVARPHSDDHLVLPGLVGAMEYAFQIVGSVFSIREPQTLGFVGLLLIVVTGYLVVTSDLRGCAFDRIGLVLIVASALFVGAFIIGRYQFGIQWALSAFHAAPLLCPFLLGSFLLALSAFHGARTRIAGACVFCLAAAFSFVSSLPYASARGDQNVKQRSLARFQGCTSQPSAYLLLTAHGVVDAPSTLSLSLPSLLPLCEGARLPKGYEVPETFQTDRSPAVTDALRDLWEVYLTHFDLQRAFPPEASDTPRRLTEFARGNAAHGSMYANEKLARHETTFKEFRF